VKTLIITEKYSQAKDLRAAIGGKFGQIIPAEGHLLRLAEPDEVNADWKRWSCTLLKPDGLYLSKLETVTGDRILFHRIGSIDRIDVFEAVTFSGGDWYILFVDFYHPRKSKITPDGFRFTREVAQFSGFHKFCQKFPYDFAEMKQTERGSGLNLAYMAIDNVSQQIQNRNFERRINHKAKLDLVNSRLSSSTSQSP
jgi:hypothetical protein